MSANKGIIFFIPFLGFDSSSFKMDEEIPFYCTGALINVHLQPWRVNSSSELHLQHCSHQLGTSERHLSSGAAVPLPVIFPRSAPRPSSLLIPSLGKQDLFGHYLLLLHNPPQHTAGSC